MKKLSLRNGETLVESLLAILVLTLVALFLTTSIATAAKINGSLKTEKAAFSYHDANAKTTAAALTITDTMHTNTVDMTKHTTSNGYVYYD